MRDIKEGNKARRDNDVCEFFFFFFIISSNKLYFFFFFFSSSLLPSFLLLLLLVEMSRSPRAARLCRAFKTLRTKHRPAMERYGDDDGILPDLIQ